MTRRPHAQSQAEPFAYLLSDASKKLLEKLSATVQELQGVPCMY